MAEVGWSRRGHRDRVVTDFPPQESLLTRLRLACYLLRGRTVMYGMHIRTNACMMQAMTRPGRYARVTVSIEPAEVVNEAMEAQAAQDLIAETEASLAGRKPPVQSIIVDAPHIDNPETETN